MARRRSWLLRFLAGAVFLALGMGAAAAWVGGETFVAPRNTPPDATVPEMVDRQLRVPCGDVVIDTWIVDPLREKNEGAVDTVVILHGKADGKKSMAALGTRFARAGVRAILVDLRGHGQSSPVELTYGVHESEDLTCMLDAVDAIVPIGSVGVYGPSYGGGVALQFAGHDERVERVVAVAAFRSFPAIARTMIELPWVAQWAVIHAAGWRAGFEPDDASPEDAVTRSRADIVLVYSEDDEIVPFSHARAVARACGSRCRLDALKGYDHLGVLSNPELRSILHRHLAAEDYPPPER